MDTSGPGLVAVTPGYVVLLVLLVVVAVGAARLGGIGVARNVVTASLRATVQLAVVSTVIAMVLGVWWGTVAFVGLMLTVASATSARRVSPHGPRAWAAGIPVVAGALPVTVAVVLAGTMPLEPVTLLTVAGIIGGGAMTATSLAGRRSLDELRDRRGEYEAALALGLVERDAALLVCRPVAASALVPSLDQTRTVGLVTLPGAFVGVLLGGGSALQAGATQLLVLVALLAADTIAVALTLELVARGVLTPEPLAPTPRRNDSPAARVGRSVRATLRR